MAKPPVFTAKTAAFATKPAATFSAKPTVLMANSPVFMQASGVAAAEPVEVAAAQPMVKTHALAEPLVLANPQLAHQVTKINPHVLNILIFHPEGVPREQLQVPVCPVPEATDTVLYEDARDPAKKLYLPRYRLREQQGRYEIGVSAAAEGGWRLSVGLERFPAPELGAGVQGAAEMQTEEIAVFFRYGAGPSNSIQQRVDFTERVDDANGVTVSVLLSTSERDSLLLALQTPAASTQLVVRRPFTIAINTAEGMSEPRPQVLMLKSAAVRRSAAAPAVAEMTMVRPLALEAVEGMQFVAHRPPPLRPETLYRTVKHALDDVADPEPFLLDPRLHGYLFEGVSIGGGASAEEYRRIPLAYPAGSGDFYPYLQNRNEPWVFYYLPDRFKLARREAPPFLPQMVVRISAEDGLLDSASVSVVYWLEPWTDATRLAAAAEGLRAQIPVTTAGRSDPEMRPLHAKASFRLWLPGPAGDVLAQQDAGVIDLATGFSHSLSLPLEQFRRLYAAAFSRDATNLFSGQVLVETGLSSPEVIPVAVRFADTEGEIFHIVEKPSGDGSVAVTFQNAIESPVRLSALPAKIRSGGQELAGVVEGVSFDPPIELAPGAELAFTVRAEGGAPAEGEIDAVFDLSGARIVPDPDRILPLISDTSVPAQYERQINVLTVPELLGAPEDPGSIVLLTAEFKGSGSVRLTRDQLEMVAAVRLPVMDFLLGRDTVGTYKFRQQIVRRDGSRSVDQEWREEALSDLVLPMP